VVVLVAMIRFSEKWPRRSDDSAIRQARARSVLRGPQRASQCDTLSTDTENGQETILSTDASASGSSCYCVTMAVTQHRSGSSGGISQNRRKKLDHHVRSARCLGFRIGVALDTALTPQGYWGSVMLLTRCHIQYPEQQQSPKETLPRGAYEYARRPIRWV
jgi:hypothetical protein